jgi:hypothetical protein
MSAAARPMAKRNMNGVYIEILDGSNHSVVLYHRYGGVIRAARNLWFAGLPFASTLRYGDIGGTYFSSVRDAADLAVLGATILSKAVFPTVDQESAGVGVPWCRGGCDIADQRSAKSGQSPLLRPLRPRPQTLRSRSNGLSTLVASAINFAPTRPPLHVIFARLNVFSKQGN